LGPRNTRTGPEYRGKREGLVFVVENNRAIKNKKFLWRLAQHSIPTADVLRRRNMWSSEFMEALFG
jgi:hypothetical protein